MCRSFGGFGERRCAYAEALYSNRSATLRELREAVTSLEDAGRARRVFGCSHPIAKGIEGDLRKSRTVLRARESQQQDPGA